MKVKRLHEDAKLPVRAHPGDLGYDLFAVIEGGPGNGLLMPGESMLVRTGIACSLPDNIGLLLKDRSSIASKYNVYVHAGVIDNAYRGEIKILIHNHGLVAFKLMTGDKIAQAVPIEVHNFDVEEIDDFEDSTDRGEGGFGSTGS